MLYTTRVPVMDRRTSPLMRIQWLSETVTPDPRSLTDLESLKIQKAADRASADTGSAL